MRFSGLPSEQSLGFLPAATGFGHRIEQRTEQRLPICRLVNEEWECQWSDGTDSSAYGSDGDVCGLRHRDLRNLSDHFRKVHAPFRDANPPFYWICNQCQLNWEESPEICPQAHCSGRWTFEQWYFGQVALPAAFTSPMSARVPSQGTSPPRQAVLVEHAYRATSYPWQPYQLAWRCLGQELAAVLGTQ